MVHGYDCVHDLAAGLQAFMRKKEFAAVADFQGLALPHVTLHSALVAAQRDAIAAKKEAQRDGGGVVKADDEWDGDAFQAQSEALVSNKE